jgi:hypothetical protein
VALLCAVSALLALGACGDDVEHELDARADDARPPVADGGACVVWPADVREAECKALCVPENLCAGAESAGCLSGTSYCPVL